MVYFEVLVVVMFFNTTKGFHQACFCISGIHNIVDKNAWGL